MSFFQPRTVLIAIFFIINSIEANYGLSGIEPESETIWPAIECVDSKLTCDMANVRFLSWWGKFDLTLHKTRLMFSDWYKEQLEHPEYWDMSKEATSECYYHQMDESVQAFLSICEGRVNGIVMSGNHSFEVHYSHGDGEHKMSRAPVANGDNDGTVLQEDARRQTWQNLDTQRHLGQQPQGLLNLLYTVEPSATQKGGGPGRMMTMVYQFMAVIVPAMSLANVQVSLSGVIFWPTQFVPYPANLNGQRFLRDLQEYWASNYLPTGLYDVAIHLTDKRLNSNGMNSTGIVATNSICGRQGLSYQSILDSFNRGITTLASDQVSYLGQIMGARALRAGECGCAGDSDCWLVNTARRTRPARRWSTCSLTAFANKIRSPEGDCLTRNGPPTTTTTTAPAPQPQPTSRPPPGPSTTTTTTTTPDAPTTVAETEPVPLEAGPNYLLFGLLALLLLLLLLGLLIFVVAKKKKRDGQLRSSYLPSSSVVASNAMRSSYAGGTYGSGVGSQRSGLSRMSSGVGSSRSAMSQQSARSGLSRASGAGSTFADQRSRFSGASNASAASLASRRSGFTGSRI